MPTWNYTEKLLWRASARAPAPAPRATCAGNTVRRAFVRHARPLLATRERARRVAPARVSAAQSPLRARHIEVGSAWPMAERPAQPTFDDLGATTRDVT